VRCVPPNQQESTSSTQVSYLRNAAQRTHLFWSQGARYVSSLNGLLDYCKPFFLQWCVGEGGWLARLEAGTKIFLFHCLKGQKDMLSRGGYFTTPGAGEISWAHKRIRTPPLLIQNLTQYKHTDRKTLCTLHSDSCNTVQTHHRLVPFPSIHRVERLLQWGSSRLLNLLHEALRFTPRPLYPQGKSPWYPLNRRLGGPQSRSGRCGEEKNSQPPLGIEP
jgi:hypothetical protein